MGSIQAVNKIQRFGHTIGKRCFSNVDNAKAGVALGLFCKGSSVQHPSLFIYSTNIEFFLVCTFSVWMIIAAMLTYQRNGYRS